MSVSVSGGGTPDVVHLLMMRKAMSAEQTQSAQLLEGLLQQPAAPTSPAPVSSTPKGTFYL